MAACNFCHNLALLTTEVTRLTATVQVPCYFDRLQPFLVRYHVVQLTVDNATGFFRMADSSHIGSEVLGETFPALPPVAAQRFPAVRLTAPNQFCIDTMVIAPPCQLNSRNSLGQGSNLGYEETRGHLAADPILL